MKDASENEKNAQAFERINKLALPILELLDKANYSAIDAEAVLAYIAGLSLGKRAPDPSIVDDFCAIVRSAYYFSRNQDWSKFK